MTNEEARTALGDRNNLLWGMSKEEQEYYSEALEMAISALSAKIPTNGERFSCPNCGFKADWFIPKREKGEWQKSDIPESMLCKCSKCGWQLGAYTHHYCANCGADMRGKT